LGKMRGWGWKGMGVVGGRVRGPLVRAVDRKLTASEDR
jgi:hypothetical protein